MDNDSKNVLMQYLYRFAEHYGIANAEQVSFKKREILLTALKQKEHEAWVVMNNLIGAFIKTDRIQNDKVKQEKAHLLWESEFAGAEKEKVSAELDLIKFCKAHGIQVGKISQSV